MPRFSHPLREVGIFLFRILASRANDIRQQWIDYWMTVTGHRSTMTINPH
ncbi:MAG: hypothetical protein WBC78_26190 [Candidatus Sulfotelmatobacter sp.]